MHLTVVREDVPGSAWLSLWSAAGRAYLAWFEGGGRRAPGARRPTAGESAAALREHMPELAPMYERLVGLAGGSDGAARLLSLWCPPAFAVGCSMAVWDGGKKGAGARSTIPSPGSLRSPPSPPGGEGEGPVLVRNYEFHPALFDAVLLRSVWGERAVLGMSDCLWGMVDGVNDAGLAVALAYGGSTAVGAGFGIPLVLRYVLETCETAAEAVGVLARVPSHMAYNVMVVDGGGERAVVEVGPGRAGEVRKASVCANHQRGKASSVFARATASRERQDVMTAARGSGEGLEEFIGRFQRKPLYSRAWSQGWATLYTAAYWPGEGRVELRWPGEAVLARSLATCEAGERWVMFGAEEPGPADVGAAEVGGGKGAARA